jgi:hypothetical protein
MTLSPKRFHYKIPRHRKTGQKFYARSLRTLSAPLRDMRGAQQNSLRSVRLRRKNFMPLEKRRTHFRFLTEVIKKKLKKK